MAGGAELTLRPPGLPWLALGAAGSSALQHSPRGAIAPQPQRVACGAAAARLRGPALQWSPAMASIGLRVPVYASPSFLRGAARADCGHCRALAAQVGTGKTSLVRQYVHKTFSNNYKSTIGAPLSKPPRPLSLLTPRRT